MYFLGPAGMSGAGGGSGGTFEGDGGACYGNYKVTTVVNVVYDIFETKVNTVTREVVIKSIKIGTIKALITTLTLPYAASRVNFLWGWIIAEMSNRHETGIMCEN